MLKQFRNLIAVLIGAIVVSFFIIIRSGALPNMGRHSSTLPHYQDINLQYIVASEIDNVIQNHRIPEKSTANKAPQASAETVKADNKVDVLLNLQGAVNVPALQRPVIKRKSGALTAVGPINVDLKGLKVGLITPQEGIPAKAKYFEMCAFSKGCYAKMHGIDFILDRANYSQTHNRHRTWNRIPTLQRYLPQYDWLVYLDADIAIANFSISLIEFIGQFHDDTRLAFTDATTGFNAGAFFIKNHPWSLEFLQKWWDQSLVHSKGIAGFNSNDQVAVWDVIVDMLMDDLNSPPEVRAQKCRSSPLLHRQDWQRAMKCYSDMMALLHFPLGQRDKSHIQYWNYQTQWPRGFTFFYPDKAAKGTWPRAELFMKGDWVIHTRLSWRMREVGAYDEMKASEFCASTLAEYPVLS